MYLYPRSSPEKEMEKLPVVQLRNGNSHVIKVIISPAKFPRDTISTMRYFFLYFLDNSSRSVL